MRKTFIPLGLGILIALGVVLPERSFAQGSKMKPEVAAKDSVAPNKKEEKNRHEMLSADSNAGPRDVNIGLPFQDMVILENGVPVTYNYYPQTPISDWRYDASIGKIGLQSFAENALTLGRIGFAVESFDRDPGKKFQGFFRAYTNNFGSLIYSGSVSGPIGKNGWGYVVDLSETYDRGNGGNRQYTPWNDRCEIIKTGLSKKYKNGFVELLYKHAEQYTQYSSYWPFIYKGNGNYSQVPGFKSGTDSYVLGNGMLPYKDAQTGVDKIGNLGDAKANTTVSDAIYLKGNHDFGEGLKLIYTTMYMHANAPFSIQYPVSLQVMDPDQQVANGLQFKLNGQSAVYNGSAQLITNEFISPTQTNSEFTHIELTKKIDNHSLRLGFTDQYYANLGEQINYGLYYQTVSPNPKLLDMYMPALAAYGMNPQITDANGLLNQAMGDYQKFTTNKAAIYFSDDANLTPWLNVGIGGRIEKQDDQDTHDQYVNDFIKGRSLMTNNYNNKFNHVALGSFLARVNRKFGFIGDVTYNDFYNRSYGYPAAQLDATGNPLAGAQTSEVIQNQIHIMNIGAGVYYNAGDVFSITTKVGSIKKDNYSNNLVVYNPANANQSATVPVIYGISTLGWTTDLVTSPFKNFNLHYLITIQNPQFNNYSVNAFGKNYDYDNVNVPGISKVLMEIDPSYQLGDFRLWASVRYFGKQYGNLTNSFAYNPWWENFAGVDYVMNRKVDFKLQIVNFLNQEGIKGALQGADQITDSSPYIGRTVVAQAIRPRTIEFTVNLKL